MPFLVLLDLSLPGKGGIATFLQIRKLERLAKVLVFSVHQSPVMAKKAIQAGARGYVTKSSEPSVLLQSILDVMLGRLAISDDIIRAIAMKSFSNDVSILNKLSARLNKLSAREFEILRMLA